MQILVIPSSFDTRASWSNVITNLEGLGYRVTYLEYTPPKNDDIEEQVNLAATYLVEKTLIVGSDLGGRIAIQLLARKNPYICCTLLLSTPSLLYKSLFTRFLLLLNFALGPIRLFISHHRKQKIGDLILRLRYPSPEKFRYQKNINSEQDTLLPIIKVFVRMVWGEKNLRTPREVGVRMHRMIEKSDLVTLDGRSEPLQTSSPDIISNYIDEMARTY